MNKLSTALGALTGTSEDEENSELDVPRSAEDCTVDDEIRDERV